MKFQLAINMERTAAHPDMREVARHTLEMVQMADEAGSQSPGRRSTMRWR